MDLTLTQHRHRHLDRQTNARLLPRRRLHGAIQMLVEPTGRRMTGKWVGFGKGMEINTGPWELIFEDASTTKATLDSYNRRRRETEQPHRPTRRASAVDITPAATSRTQR